VLGLDQAALDLGLGDVVDEQRALGSERLAEAGAAEARVDAGQLEVVRLVPDPLEPQLDRARIGAPAGPPASKSRFTCTRCVECVSKRIIWLPLPCSPGVQVDAKPGRS
jgi:hypothetical protein